MIASALALASAAVRAAGRDPVIVSDDAGWALDDQARGIARHLPSPLRAAVIGRLPPGIRGKTIHFFNRYAALERDDLPALARSNRLIVSWTHGGAGDEVTPELRALAERMRELARHFSRVHVAASMYGGVVESLGVDRERIRCVPFAIDTARFETSLSRPRCRERLGLPADARILGSFQRDGEDEPKLVKGPDRLVELAVAVRQQVPTLHVLLTGPARGWVRRALEARAIPFTYLGLIDNGTVPLCYRACDAYAITSREEGGPLALLEAMASGVPLVSMRVGMVPDVVEDGRTALLGDDIASLARATAALLGDPYRAQRIAAAAHDIAGRYDWKVVGPRYASELYASVG